MIKYMNFRWVWLAVLATAWLFVNDVKAVDTIISDELKGSYVTIVGKTPATNLPGASWQIATGWTYSQSLYPTADGGGARWNSSNGCAAAISLASTGSYTKPAAMTIKADINQTTAVSGNSPWGVLGFYSALEASSGGILTSKTNFTGIVLNYDGSLSLYNAGALVTGSTVAFGGTYSRDTYYTLSYTINTTSGAISAVTLSGSTANYAPLMASAAPFTNAKTAYAGMGGSADNVTTSRGNARFKNFSVVSASTASGAGTLIRLSRADLWSPVFSSGQLFVSSTSRGIE